MKSSAFRLLWPVLLPVLIVAVSASRAQSGPNPPGLIQGQEALAAFGANLPVVAAQYDRTPEQFAAMLQRDKDLWVDRAGRLLYRCEGMANPPGDKAAASVSGLPIAPFPQSETFKLHSRPTSTKKIFLDFDGHLTSGTPWAGGADIVSTPFDQDGSPNSFSAGEHESIQKIWQRVTEDFAPFDVDVTTEDPGVSGLTRISAGDQSFGTRVVISPVETPAPGAGGVAFLGVFDAIVAGNDIPCFAFSANVGNFADFIAEVCSHEVGHTVGLNHDGGGGAEYWDGGAGNWAPIMGVGYGKQIVQWSKGEYAGASNTEDDYPVIQSNSCFFRADDHANAPGGATTLAGSTLNGAAIIQSTADKDFFRFGTKAGNVTINAVGGPPSPNVDIKLELFDAGGALIDSSDPGGTNASISKNLAQGIYFVSVDGVGAGDPVGTGYSDYGSLGEVRISGSVIGGINLTVAAPNGGQSLSVGSNFNITWLSDFITSNVKLELSTNGGNTWTTIAASTANDGIEAWTVPNSPTTQARIRISTVDGAVADISNNSFTITAAVGDAFEADDIPDFASELTPGVPQAHTIHVPGDQDWAFFSLFERSNVTLTTDGAAGDTVLELYGPDDPDALLDSDDDGGNGAFSQILRTGSGALAAGDYWVRVREKTGVGGIAAYNLSLATSPGASINLISPNGGENWQAGSQQVIIWTSFGVTGNVRLEWYDGFNWWLITDSTPDDGSHLWTVPTVSTLFARVRVTPVNDPVAEDASEDDFTIFQPPTPTLDVLFPDGGESLPGGEETDIVWDSSDVAGNVRIEFSLNGGKTWTTLAPTSANDGVEPWIVPNVPTGQALVRVSAVNGTVSDQSDDFFFIPGPEGDEFEDDDTPQNALDILNGETQDRSIHLAGNADWVAVVLTAKRKIVLTTSAGTPGGDTVITLYRSDASTVVKSNDNYVAGSGYSRVISTKLPPGTYFAKVTGKGQSTIAAYRLTLQLKK